MKDYTDTPLESSSLSARVLERIAAEQVTPRPRWAYRLRNRAFWVAALGALAAAAAAMAAVFFILANVEWRYVSVRYGTPASTVMAVLPVAWLVLLLVFLSVGYWNIRHTSRGYRYPLPVVAAMAVVFTILSGAAFFSIGLGQGVEEGFGGHLPLYRPFLVREQSWWSRPEKGFLVGKVSSIAPDFSSFALTTDSGVVWQVEGSDLRAPDMAWLARGGMVRVVGVPRPATSTAPFHACFVLPWEVRGARASLPPLPLAVLSASTSERISNGERSNACKGVGPYRVFRALQDDMR